jgi:hypothetical protein
MLISVWCKTRKRNFLEKDTMKCLRLKDDNMVEEFTAYRVKWRDCLEDYCRWEDMERLFRRLL